jgi:transposase-like protein
MQEKRARRTFTAEFKQNAVNKVLVEGRPVTEVARDLDINRVSLDSWIRAAKDQSIPATMFSDTEEEVNTEPMAEVAAPAEAPAEKPATIRLKKKAPAEAAPAQEAAAPAESAEAAPAAQPERKVLSLKPGFRKERGEKRVQVTKSDGSQAENVEMPRAYVSEDENDIKAVFDRIDRENAENPQKKPQVQPAAEKPAEHAPTRKVMLPSNARWHVYKALDQHPEYRERNAALGFKDSFEIPGRTLPEVWEYIKNLKEAEDRAAFSRLVEQEGHSVSQEVLDNPRLKNVENDNRQHRKPWQKPVAKLDPVAKDFFNTVPDYTKSVYEEAGPISIKVAPHAVISPVISVEGSEDRGWTMVVDFSKFDRFVDEFYGPFVNECKTILMQHNPKEYHSLNAFIRYPDHPAWNPKLWAGERTIFVKPRQSFAEAWLQSIQAI